MTSSVERDFYQLLAQYGPEDKELIHIDPHLVAVRANLEKLSALEPTKKNFVILFGASGAGKDEIIKHLDPTQFAFLRTMTTRAPRSTDRPGSYRHVERHEFEKLYEQGFFLEKNAFGAEHKNLYGTPKEDVQKVIENPKPALAIIDHHGVSAFLALQTEGEILFKGVRLIACHIAPPNLKELERRLLERDGNLHRWPLVEGDLKGMKIAHYILDNDDLNHSLELVNLLANSREIVGLKP